MSSSEAQQVRKHLRWLGALMLTSWAAGCAPIALDIVRALHSGPRLFPASATLKADSWVDRLLHREDYELAIRHARACLEVDPHSAACHRSLGIALARSGQRDAALREYREAMKTPHEWWWDVNVLVSREDYHFMD